MKKIEDNFHYSLLYVEDEALIRQNAVEFLSDRFDEIFEAENGVQALTLYEAHQPSIIITDIEMPQMNGLALCREIRKSDEKTPIIITTAYADQHYLLEAIELNLVKYLIKPIDEESLNQALKECFEKLAKGEKSITRLTKEHYFDQFNMVLFYRGEQVHLTANELSLLLLLLNQHMRVVTYSEIENHIWNGEYMSEDALKGLVKNLRKKLSKETIENHSKIGYKIHLYHG